MDAKRKALALEDMAAHAAAPIINARGVVKVVAHFDCDGICAAAIMQRTLTLLKKDFKISFVKNLGKEELREIYLEKNGVVVFLDIGSGQLGLIDSVRFEIPIVVCDHHPPEDVAFEGLYHMNPIFCGIEGDKEISGAGMAYALSRKVSLRTKDLVWLAIVGAAGDRQYSGDMFFGMNQMMLEEAEYSGALRCERGLKLFGRYTRPIHKALEFSYEPFIEKVSGNESGSVQFLSELGIPVIDRKGNFRRLADLSIAEEKKLATALAVEHAFSGGEATDVIGKRYRLKNNYDVMEFATVINACGRLEKPFLGIEICQGKSDGMEKVVNEYRKKLAGAVAWCRNNRKRFVEGVRATYIVAGRNIDENIIGTVISTVMKSMVRKSIVFGFSSGIDEVKVSARVKNGSRDCREVNLGEHVRAVVREIGGDARGGGHSCAAGAVIPCGSETEFIEISERLLNMQQDDR